MKQFIEYIMVNWQEIVEYIVIALSYVYVFFNNNRVKQAKITMRDFFSQGVKDVQSEKEKLLAQNARITRLENTVAALIGEKEVDENESKRS